MSALPFMDGIRTSDWRRENTVIVNQSPFSGKPKRSELSDWRWTFKFDYAPMKRAVAAPLLAAIAAQRNGAGSFLAHDPDCALPLSTYLATGSVNGSNNAGIYLNTKGWSNDTLVARASDKLWIGYGAGPTQMFTVVGDVVSNGAGFANFILDAPVRGTPIANAGIGLAWSPLGIAIPCRLTSWSAPCDVTGTYAISISGEEIV